MTTGGVAAAALVGLCAAVGAQTPLTSKQAAYTALLLTPSGALPTVVRSHRGVDTAARAGVDFLYGRYRFPDNPIASTPLIVSIGAGAEWRVMPRLEVGAIVGLKRCDECQGARIASVGANYLVWAHESLDGGSTTDVNLLLNAGIGSSYGETSRVQGRTLSAMLPIVVGLPQQGDSYFSLVFAPSWNYGYVNDGSGSVLGYAGGDGGSVLAVNAGVAYAFPFGLGIHADVHRIIIEESPTQLGFALSWRFGPRPAH